MPIPICVSGCFLELHSGHIDYLRQAIELAAGISNRLLLIINSEDYLREKYQGLVEGAGPVEGQVLGHRFKPEVRQEILIEAIVPILEEANPDLMVEFYVSDNALEEEWMPEQVTWVVGPDYANLEFKESRKVWATVVVRNEKQSAAEEWESKWSRS